MYFSIKITTQSQRVYYIKRRNHRSEKDHCSYWKIEPRDEILIKPQISGIIDEVYKEAGQKIKKGEVIAKVKVIPELGQLNSAESRVRLAEINARQGETDFARMKKLFESKLISSEEYEKSEVAVKQAREELQTAKDNLEIVKEGITKTKLHSVVPLSDLLLTD